MITTTTILVYWHFWFTSMCIQYMHAKVSSGGKVRWRTKFVFRASFISGPVALSGWDSLNLLDGTLIHCSTHLSTSQLWQKRSSYKESNLQRHKASRFCKPLATFYLGVSGWRRSSLTLDGWPELKTEAFLHLGLSPTNSTSYISTAIFKSNLFFVMKS